MFAMKIFHLELFSYACSSTLHPRQRVSEWVVVLTSVASRIASLLNKNEQTIKDQHYIRLSPELNAYCGGLMPCSRGDLGWRLDYVIAITKNCITVTGPKVLSICGCATTTWNIKAADQCSNRMYCSVSGLSHLAQVICVVFWRIRPLISHELFLDGK